MSTDTSHTPAPAVVDLTGLPDPVVKQVLQIIHEARQKQAQGAAPSVPEAVGARAPLLGRFAHLGLSFPKEDLDEAQRDAWSTFPRDFPDKGQ